jgi:hypothetical protein
MERRSPQPSRASGNQRPGTWRGGVGRDRRFDWGQNRQTVIGGVRVDGLEQLLELAASVAQRQPLRRPLCARADATRRPAVIVR